MEYATPFKTVFLQITLKMDQWNAFTVQSIEFFNLFRMLQVNVYVKIKLKVKMVNAETYAEMDLSSTLLAHIVMTIILLVVMDVPQLVKFKRVTHALMEAKLLLLNVSTREYLFRYHFYQLSIL